MARPSRVQHIEGPARVLQTWTPPTVRAALAQMQRGDMTLAGPLADAVLGDDRAQSVLGTRVHGLLGLPFNFDPADDTPRAKTVAELAQEDWFTFAPENKVNEWLTYALLCGSCAAELVWRIDDERQLPHLKVWHPSHLRKQNGEWQVLTVDGTWRSIEPGDGQWSILAPFGERRAGTKALLRPLALAWLSKHYAVSDWNRYSEIYGGPVRAGVAPIGASEDERREFVRDLRNIANDTSVVLPDGWEMKLVEATGGSSDVFHELIEWADKAMAVAALGQNLTTDVSGGSYAAAMVHENVRHDLLRSDVETLTTTVRDEVIMWWAAYNFGDAARAIAPWPRWDAEPPEDDEATARAWDSKAGALSKLAIVQGQTGLPVDWRQVAETLRVPLLKGVDITPPAPPAAPVDASDDLLLNTRRLATGDTGPDANAFVRSQVWIDDAADYMAAEGTDATAEMLTRLTEIVTSAETYDDLRRRLIREFESLGIERVRALTESAVTLAVLSGRFAVRSEVGA